MIKKVTIDDILKNKESEDFHIVCQAAMGYTTLGTLFLGSPFKSQMSQFCSEVRLKKEVGTLFPRLNISCFHPADEQEIGDQAYYEKFIIDTLNLHEQHVKSKVVAFVFDRYGMPFDRELAEKVLLEVYKNRLNSNFDYEIQYAIY